MEMFSRPLNIFELAQTPLNIAEHRSTSLNITEQGVKTLSTFALYKCSDSRCSVKCWERFNGALQSFAELITLKMQKLLVTKTVIQKLRTIAMMHQQFGSFSLKNFKEQKS